MITLPAGMPRPSVTEVLAHGGGGYQSVDLSDPSGAVVTEHRLEMIGHAPCGWENPTWPDEAAGRLAAHLTTCVYPAEPMPAEPPGHTLPTGLYSSGPLL